MKRAALIIHLGCDFNGEEAVPYMNADCQIWQDGEFIATVDVKMDTKPDPITSLPDMPIEQWAAMIARRATRVIEDNFHQALVLGAIHHMRDFNIVTQVTPDPKK